MVRCGWCGGRLRANLPADEARLVTGAFGYLAVGGRLSGYRARRQPRSPDFQPQRQYPHHLSCPLRHLTRHTTKRGGQTTVPS